MSAPVAVLVAIASLAGCAAAGWAADAALGLFRGLTSAARWPLRALTALAALYVATVSLPFAAVAAVGATALAARARRRASPAAPAAEMGGAPASRALGVLLVGWVALANVRPLTPLYWDEFVWTTKAAIEARGGWGALRTAALSGGTDVFPAGYPLLWSLAPAWLVRDAGLAALTVAFLVMKLLLAQTFVHVAKARLLGWRRELLAGIAVVAAAPLVFVHAGAFYGELSVGLLAATLLAALASSDEDAPIALPVVLAIVLVGCKDEGLAHVLVAAGSAVAASAIARRGAPDASAVRAASATVVAAALVFGAWRLVLARAGVHNLDHRVSAPHVGALPAIAVIGARDALDPLSWGALWPACAASVGFVAWRARASTARVAPVIAFALAPVAQLGALTVALACGPDRLRAFALAGTLTNRWFVQMAPTAALAIAGALRSAGAFGSRSDGVGPR
jgi:hypothetical protein